ncbi:MAG: outer membrane lipid asymmetry maintenance protein MlaD [Pseudomonadota bacterium]
MRDSGFVETLLGVVVVATAAAFLFYAYSLSGSSAGRGSYELEAVFGRVDGVGVGSEVRIAGVKVGSVTQNALDPSTYEARLKMAIDASVAVPEDSAAKIVSDGVLGGAHVAIEPGGAEEMLIAGDIITITQGSVDLLGLAVQAFTNNSGSTSDNSGSTSEAEGDGSGEPAGGAGLDPLGLGGATDALEGNTP